MKKSDVKKLKHQELVKFTEMLIDKLDELSEDDFFGTEGWRHFLGMDD